jgi:hypothetical protein
VLTATRLDTVIHMYDSEAQAVAAVAKLPESPELP